MHLAAHNIMLTCLCIASLSACAIQPKSQKQQFDAEVVRIGCAINYAAIPKMRERGILPDPDMIKGCPERYARVTVDITPDSTRTIPESGVGAQLYQSLIKRRMARRFADEVAKSPAFAEWEVAARNWISAPPDP